MFLNYPFNTSKALKSSKACAVDLDETIGLSIENWLKFVNLELGTNYTSHSEVKETLSYNKYRRLKDKYRRGTFKSTIELRDYTVELLNFITDILELKIYLISKRPVDKYPNLLKLTVDWCNKYNLPITGFIFSEHKEIEVIKVVPYLEFYINDHLTESNILSRLGYTTYLIQNEYNQGLLEDNVIPVKDFKELKRLLEVKYGISS